MLSFTLARHVRSRAAALVHDLLMIPVAWLGAYWLRYNLESVPAPFLDRAIELLPLVLVVQGAVFVYFGLYRGVWRFASLPDLLRIAKAVAAGVAALAIGIFLLTRMSLVPRSVLPLYGGLLLGLLGGPRMLYRWLKDHKLAALSARRVLIVGSGEAAELLVRDLLRNSGHGYVPVAIVDDNRGRLGREIHAIRVIGTTADVPALVERLGVELILIAIPSVTSRQMRRVVEVCERAGVPFRTLPPLKDLVTGQVAVSALREVSIEDLLGREPVRIDWDALRAHVQGRTVLVTGGAGSIGSELCRQIVSLEPEVLVVADRDEASLYHVEQELLGRSGPARLRFVLLDVCDRAALDHLFGSAAPSLVFHAAAYKQVPMLESHLRESVRNNVLGSRNVARASIEHAADAFVLISTDKAVNPSNVMGATKRSAEILCQGLHAGSGTRLVTVRFGNVLGSAGSVVPLFRRQIAAGGPVTVTHPDVTRYFMTISEACQLIVQSMSMGAGGETYVLDMGEPIPIRYLAEQMILLSGARPGEDVEIVYTGLRPGEKMTEELFHADEALIATGHAKILRARNRPVDARRIEAVLEAMDAACERFDEEALGGLLGRLVPEFHPAPVAPAPVTIGANVVQLDPRGSGPSSDPSSGPSSGHGSGHGSGPGSGHG